MATASLTHECRSRLRYAVNLELQFSYRRGKRTWFGSGRTRDVNAHVICFESDQEIPRGVVLDVCIAWPASAEDLPVEVLIQGPVVRRQGSFAVLQMDTLKFRTRGEISFHEPSSRGSVCDLLA
jgi:hypothetical protein